MLKEKFGSYEDMPILLEGIHIVEVESVTLTSANRKKYPHVAGLVPDGCTFSLCEADPKDLLKLVGAQVLKNHQNHLDTRRARREKKFAKEFPCNYPFYLHDS